MPLTIIAVAALQVWVALDIAHHKHFMYRLIQTLVGYVALATLVAGILGWWAASIFFPPPKYGIPALSNKAIV